METGLIWALTGLLLTVGLVGSVFPSVPGPLLILAAGLIHGWLAGWETVGVNTLIFLGIVAAVLQVADYMAGAYGAKKLGGTRAGMIGSIVGSLVGFFFGAFIGMALGCFIGAAVGEMLFSGQNLQSSLKIGFGSLLGLLASTVLRVIASVVMVVVFLLATLT